MKEKGELVPMVHIDQLIAVAFVEIGVVQGRPYVIDHTSVSHRPIVSPWYGLNV